LNGRRLRPREPLDLRAIYTLGDVARAVGVSAYVMRSLLRKRGVELLHSARLDLVPLCEIQEKVPQLWRSILLSEATRSQTSTEFDPF
jgi:hypothetical protein